MCVALPVKVMAALVAYIEFDAAGATNGGGGGEICAKITLRFV